MEVLRLVTSGSVTGAADASPTIDTLRLSGMPMLWDGRKPRHLLSNDEFAGLRRAANRVAEAHTERAIGALTDAGSLGLTGLDDESLARFVFASTKLDVLEAASRLVVEATAVARAVESQLPARLEWVTEDERSAASVARAAGVLPISTFSRAMVAGSGRTEGITRRLKAWRVDGFVRLVSSYPRALKRAGRPSGATLGIFDVRNGGMVENLAAALTAAGRPGAQALALVVDPRVERLVSGAAGGLDRRYLASWVTGRSLIGAGARVGRVQAVLRGLAADAGDELSQAASELSNVAVPEGVGRAASDRLRALFSRQYVWQTLVEAMALEGCVRETGPSCLVTSSDAHHYSRAAVMLARAAGVRSVVMQHGALVGENVYVPVTADVMAAWGPWCAEWFVHRGTPRHQVVAAGYPRGAVAEPLEAQARCDRLLFPAQPLPDDVTAELLDIVIEHLRDRATSRLRIRPHPGDSRMGALRSYVEGVDEGLRARVELTPPGMSLAEDLAWADVVVGSESTVGLDGLVAGVPLVLLRHQKVSSAVPFAEFGAAPEAHDGRELTLALDGIRGGGTAAGVHRFLEQYVGATGARAAANVVELMRSRVGEGGRAREG